MQVQSSSQYSHSLNYGCSDFQLKPQDGSIICGRAMDFALPMNSQVVANNREEQCASTAPDGSRGLQWTSKYGFVGINAFGLSDVDEGLNEKGLSAGVLTLQGSIYPTVPTNEQNLSLAIMDSVKWILGCFATVDEVKKEIGSVRIWGNVVSQIQSVPQLHIALHDSTGKNLVTHVTQNLIDDF